MAVKNAEELREILLELVKTYEARFGRRDEFGQRYTLDFTLEWLDVVALTIDLPDYNLWRGQVGSVVETLADGAAFEVEFSDRDGRTYESVGLRREQIMVLHFEPASPDIKPELVTA